MCCIHTKTHIIQDTNAQTLSKAPNPALEPYPPPLSNHILPHTVTEIWGESTIYSLLPSECYNYIQAESEQEEFQLCPSRKISLTYNQCIGDGTACVYSTAKCFSSEGGGVIGAKCKATVVPQYEVRRLGWSFHIMIEVFPFHHSLHPIMMMWPDSGGEPWEWAQCYTHYTTSMLTLKWSNMTKSFLNYYLSRPDSDTRET